ncbi:MAG: transposase domain-containing protein [Pseudomonadota bacterium]
MAKLNGIDPQYYLAYMIARIIAGHTPVPDR